MQDIRNIPKMYDKKQKREKTGGIFSRFLKAIFGSLEIFFL